MGGEYHDITFEGKLSKEQVNTRFDDVIEESAHENGYGGYTGSFAEKQVVSFPNKTFPDTSEAEEWVIENAEKWGNALAVRAGDKWYIGAWCSS